MKTLLLTLVFCLFSFSAFSQEAIKVPAKNQAKPVYVNSQGFKVSGSIPDTCKVYQGSKGGKFVYRQSKKTGKVYKSYLKF
jgi:hypothetical protein